MPRPYSHRISPNVRLWTPTGRRESRIANREWRMAKDGESRVASGEWSKTGNGEWEEQRIANGDWWGIRRGAAALRPYFSYLTPHFSLLARSWTPTYRCGW
jgi:hypothetical protein